ncbi:hypothetical protein TrRE_jg2359, partial [Triparma retinervis]
MLKDEYNMIMSPALTGRFTPNWASRGEGGSKGGGHLGGSDALDYGLKREETLGGGGENRIVNTAAGEILRLSNELNRTEREKEEVEDKLCKAEEREGRLEAELERGRVKGEMKRVR